MLKNQQNLLLDLCSSNEHSVKESTESLTGPIVIAANELYGIGLSLYAIAEGRSRRLKISRRP